MKEWCYLVSRFGPERTTEAAAAERWDEAPRAQPHVRAHCDSTMTKAKVYHRLSEGALKALI